MDIDRAIATAKRLIEANGQAVIWRRALRAAPIGQPWRDVALGAPDDTPVSILWITPKLRKLAFLQLAEKIDIPNGVEEALMPAQSFEPELQDCVVVNGVAQSLYRVDPLKPNGTPIFYRLYLNRAGA